MPAVVAPIGDARAAHLGVRVRPWNDEHGPAVRAFNARLAARGIHYQFPEPPRADGEAAGDSPVRHTSYVALDRTCSMRGGYIIKLQDYFVGGERRPLGFYRLPLSEGLIDRRYGIIGVQLLADALKRQPELFVLGIGGFDEPLARMLVALGWKLHDVPFYFRVERPFRFARGIRHLRRTAAMRLALDAAAFSGAAWAAATALRLAKGRRPPANTSSCLIDGFNGWADHVWMSCRSQHALVGVRDAQTLNALYPRGTPRFIRLQVSGDGRPIGWAVLLDTKMAGNPYFGNLRVGSIVDCMADVGSAPAVVSHAVRLLRDRGVDVIVSNQSARCWSDSLMAEGFRQRPSGFLFGASPALAARLAPGRAGLPQFHLTRGDGDGPINL